MTLPTFKSIRFRRKEQQNEKSVQYKGHASDGGVFEDSQTTTEETSTSTSTPSTEYNPGVNVKKATRARRIAIIISSFSYFISVIFLILVRPKCPP
jgi:hypothetical protein